MADTTIFAEAQNVKEISEGLQEIHKLLTTPTTGGLLEGLQKVWDIAGKFKEVSSIAGKISSSWTEATSVIKAHEAAQRLTLVTTNGGLTLYQMLVGVLTGKITLMTAAQALLNAVTSAWPIFAIIAGIGLLTAGLIGLCKWMNKETDEEKKKREETEKLCAETEKLCEANKKVTDSISSGQTERKQKLTDIETEAIVAQKLTEELYKLAGKENKSTEEKAKMKAMVEKLNEILPDLNLQFDEENGLLSLNKEKVEEVIAAKRELAKQNAAMSMVEEGLKNQRTTGLEMDALLKDQKAIQSQIDSGLEGDVLKKAEEALKKVNERIQETARAYHLAVAEVDEGNKILDQSMGQTAEVTKKNTDQITMSFNSFAKDSAKDLEGMKKAVADFGLEMITNSDAYGAEFITAWNNAAKTAGDDAYQSIDAFMAHVLGSMDKKDQAEVYGRDGVQGYVEGGNEEAQGSQLDLAPTVEKGAEEAKQAAAEGGTSTTDAYVDSAQSNLDGKSLDDSNFLKNSISSESWKDVGTGNAKEMTDSTVKKLSEEETTIKDALTASSKNAIEAAQEEIKIAAVPLGKYLVEGIKKGIEDNTPTLDGAINVLVAAILIKFQDKSEIDSPSKLFAREVGSYITQGVAVGITSEEDAVRSAAAEVVDAAIDEANRRISRDEHGNMLVEGLAVEITVGEDFGKDAMDAAVKNLKLQLDTAAVTTADYYREIERLRNTHLTRGSEEWWKYTKEIMEYEQKRVEEAKKANKEAFEEELHLLERKQKLGLISEQEYYIGMKKLTRSYFTENEKEWQDYTEKLEDFVVKETQTLTDQVGKLLQGLYDEADKALQDVLSSMDSFRDSVSDFGNYLFHFSVKDQNGRIIDQSTGLVDFSLRQKELERFTELFKQIKALPNIPKKILEDIRKMKPEDAVRLMELMLRTPQQALQNWFQAERDFMDTVDTAADALYGDDLFAAEENIRKVDELKQSVLDMCNELGIKVPESFAAMGTASKDSFFDMFKEVAGEIEGLMEQLQFTVSLSQSELTVNVEPYSGTAATAASSSQTYAPTYYFAASGDSTARQIQAANANDTINRLRGVSF